MNHADLVARWYCVASNGIATLCLDEADARETAADADRDWPKNAPHRAVLLGDVDAQAAELAALRARVGELEGALSAATKKTSDFIREARERDARLRSYIR